jgi:HD-like signal output (HDOD) protein
MSKNDIQLSQEDLQKVLASIEIPACPAVVSSAMKEAQRDEPDLGRLADLITGDPGMSAVTLKLANSVLFGSSSAVTGVRRAVDRLGTKNVIGVIFGTALRNTLQGAPGIWLDPFWKRTSLLALSSSLIARRQYGISPDAAYTYALFRDAAMPLMMQRFPQYGEVMAQARRDGSPLVDSEARHFPCSHPVIGSLLVRNWGLPSILAQAIRFHHESDAYDVPDSTLPGAALSLIAVTQIAEYLLGETIGTEEIEVDETTFERAQAFLALSTEDVEDLRGLVASTAEGGHA